MVSASGSRGRTASWLSDADFSRILGAGNPRVFTDRQRVEMLRIVSAMLLGLMVLVASLPTQAASALVTVNGQPITDVQLAQRLALHKLQGKSNRNAALEELVDEAVQLQEAERLGIKVSESDIDARFADLAQQNRMSPSNL